MEDKTSLMDLIQSLDDKANHIASGGGSPAEVYFTTLSEDLPSLELAEASTMRALAFLGIALRLGQDDPLRIVQAAWQEGVHVGFAYALTRMCPEHHTQVRACLECDITE